VPSISSWSIMLKQTMIILPPISLFSILSVDYPHFYFIFCNLVNPVKWTSSTTQFQVLKTKLCHPSQKKAHGNLNQRKDFKVKPDYSFNFFFSHIVVYPHFLICDFIIFFQLMCLLTLVLEIKNFSKSIVLLIRPLLRPNKF
jgi:hypothetical protein